MRSPQKISDETQIIYLMEMPNGGGSDVTLKQDIAEVGAALHRVVKLRPVTWRWKEGLEEHNEQGMQYGFIAQEVEKIFPDLVVTKKWKDGSARKFLLSKGLLPYLVKAVEEQQRQIEQLEKRIAELVQPSSK
ncbi:MAG TPA: tail fiber domain-containing protein [Candidatus Saccharimonadales bacterium]